MSAYELLAAAAGDGSVAAERLATAGALLLLAAVLLVAEIFVVSFGILGGLAIAAAAWAISIAFDIGPTTGWIFLIATPLLAALILRWGIRRVLISRAVPQVEIDEHAGVQHIATRIGLELGSRGRLVTPARPGGRARFPGGDCDVQVQGGSLETGTAVIVKRIDGPMVVVAQAPAGPVEQSDAPEGRKG